MRRYIKSKTINWGHIQAILGMAIVGLAQISPEILPSVSPENIALLITALGAMKIADAMITYWLRSKTRKPLSEYDVPLEDRLK